MATTWQLLLINGNCITNSLNMDSLHQSCYYLLMSIFMAYYRSFMESWQQYNNISYMVTPSWQLLFLHGNGITDSLDMALIYRSLLLCLHGNRNSIFLILQWNHCNSFNDISHMATSIIAVTVPSWKQCNKFVKHGFNMSILVTVP